MKTYVLLTNKKWHDSLFNELSSREFEHWIRISDYNDFNRLKLNKISPSKIFIPHWSYIISEDIYLNFECVLFHMTDLPFGRGGSPLQNLILNNFKTTKITAIKVDKGIDTGPIYLKKDLDLSGTAQEIFIRSVPIIKDLIIEIIDHKIEPANQMGEPILFKRRKPEDGNLNYTTSFQQIYDYIRMLDCEGYPNAFIEYNGYKLEFSSANMLNDNEIIANVRIIKK